MRVVSTQRRMTRAATQVPGRVMVSNAPGLVYGANTGPPCLSPYQELCDDCLYLDQALGTVIDGAVQAIAYYAGPVTQEPSLAFSTARYNNFSTYYALGANSPAVFGDSDDLPPRWPYPGINAWRYFGDRTPNKIRFTDIAALWTDIWTAIVSAFNSGTTSSIGVNITSTAAVGDPPVERPSLNRNFAQLVQQVVNGLGLPELMAAAATTTQEEEQGTNAEALPPSNTSVVGWLEFLYTSIRICDFSSEIDGSHKRFSIGEAVLIVGAVAAGVTLLVALPLLGTGVATLGAMTGVATMAILLGTVVVAYDWTFRCVPAFPYQLGDDNVDFFTRTVWPRADWFYGGIINAAPDGSDPYTAAMSVQCAAYQNGTLTSGWCSGDLGFSDLGYVAVFIAGQIWPESLTYLRTTNVPILADIAKIGLVAGYLDAFENVNMTDPVQNSQHWSCATVYTAIPNAMVAFAYLYVLSFLTPLVSMLATIFVTAFYPVALAGMCAMSMLAMIMALRPAPAAPPSEEEEGTTATMAARRRAMKAVARAAHPLASEPATQLGHMIIRRMEAPVVRVAKRIEQRIRRAPPRRVNDEEMHLM